MKAKKLARLPARDEESGLVNVVIDTPRGSRTKFHYDEDTGVFCLGKVLPTGSVFPYDFGFIPSTRGDDGDPLDVLVLTDGPLFPGCLATVRLIGVLEAEQTEQGKTVRNDRLLAVVETPVNRPEVTDLEQLGPDRLAGIEHFFVSYNAAEGREFRPLARRGPKVAARLVTAALRRKG